MTNTSRFIAVLTTLCMTSLACLDPKATYEPRSGTWSYEEEAVVSNTCDDLIGNDNPNPVPSTFNLDYDEGDEFQIEQGEEDIACEIDRTEFSCADYTVGPNQVNVLGIAYDAFITYAVTWEGEFTSETIADGRSISAVTCTGDDCDMIDGLPCTREVTFTAEFQD